MTKQQQILKVLVGSRAHGLAEPTSDYDYRAVYVVPTREIVSIGHKYQGTSWIEGDKDDPNKKDQTAWEIGHFLQLATHCNPTILEVFRSPVIEAISWGLRLKDMFPYLWNPQSAFNAFVGYGLNQRTKMLDNKDKRANKYACAYIRTLYHLIQLLRDGTFQVEIPEGPMRQTLLAYRRGEFTPGEVVDLAEHMIAEAKTLRDACTHVPNLSAVNEYLVQLRYENFNVEAE